MANTKDMARLLSNFFNQNPAIMTFLGSQEKGIDDSQKDILLRMAGVNSPTAKDRGDFDSVFNMLNGSKNANTTAINNLLKTDPTKLAIETGIGAVGEASHAASDTVLNNYNKLAEAILAGSRTSGDAARNTYGKSPQERAAEHLANEKQRKGNNIAIWANVLGNIADKLTGKVERDNALERAAKMRPYDKEMNMSGQYYDAQSRMYGLR